MIIRVNMATSLDGRIAPASREKMMLGTRRDRRRLVELRAWADAVVIGAATLRAEDPPMALTDPLMVEQRRSRGQASSPAVVVVTRRLDLPVGRALEGPGRCIVATVRNAPGASPELAAVAEIWRLGAAGVSARALAERLRQEGLEHILVEGGGRLGALFLQDDLVDEIFLTVTPWLIGGNQAPTMADADQELEMPIGLEVVGIEAFSDEIFLRLRRRQPAMGDATVVGSPPAGAAGQEEEGARSG